VKTIYAFIVIFALGCAGNPFTKQDCQDIVSALAILERQIVKAVEDSPEKLQLIAQWDGLAESGLKIGCALSPLPTTPE